VGARVPREELRLRERAVLRRSAFRAGFAEERRPTGRRIGANADALWRSFKGHLTAADRIDLLLRDADLEWPLAFGARHVFRLAGVAEDEAFGADWPSLPLRVAQELWDSHMARAGVADVADLLTRIGSVWGLPLASPVMIPSVSPATRVIVAGPSGIAELIQSFAKNLKLDFSEQVTCVATPPGHRQLAAVATVCLNLGRRARVLAAAEVQGLAAGLVAIQSDDADPRDSEALARWIA